jgi:hypothetical protein
MSARVEFFTMSSAVITAIVIIFLVAFTSRKRRQRRYSRGQSFKSENP